MPRQKLKHVRYLKHSSGKGRAIWNDCTTGKRFERVLPGPYNSDESLQHLARLQLEIASKPFSPPPPKAIPGAPKIITVVEIQLAYLKYTAEHYGKGTELECVKTALKVLRLLYGPTNALEFGPRKLAAVREEFVCKGWNRNNCNAMNKRIVRMFKWAASQELIPATVYQSLKTLDPLKAGHTVAPESQHRQPATPTHVEATIPHLTPHLMPLVQLLRLTGARPAEIAAMTMNQIDRAGEVWIYRPLAHKTASRGQHRIIALGHVAQAIISEHLVMSPCKDHEAIFSPSRQHAERMAKMRKERKTKVQPSQANRKKAKPMRKPGEFFTPSAIAHGVRHAANRAKVPHWFPYQLRHLRAAELRHQFGLEHARAFLGHSQLSMSSHYSSMADEKLAIEAAKAEGATS